MSTKLILTVLTVFMTTPCIFTEAPITYSVKCTDVIESNEKATCTVTRSQTTDDAVTLNYKLTRKAPVVQKPALNPHGEKQLIFPKGEKTLKIMIPLNEDDKIIEDDEIYEVQILRPSSGNIDNGSDLLKILDDDGVMASTTALPPSRTTRVAPSTTPTLPPSTTTRVASSSTLPPLTTTRVASSSTTTLPPSTTTRVASSSTTRLPPSTTSRVAPSTTTRMFPSTSPGVMASTTTSATVSQTENIGAEDTTSTTDAPTRGVTSPQTSPATTTQLSEECKNKIKKFIEACDDYIKFLRGRIEDLKDCKKSLEEKLDSLERKNKALNDENERLKDGIRDIKERLQTLENE